MINEIEIKSIGEILKLRRKELNITLKEAENATSIRASYLHSLEEGDVSRLISPIYAQGFIKQYTTFLGLDTDKIIEEHPGIFSQAIAQEFAYGIGTLETRSPPGSGVKWIPNAAVVLAFAIILALAWYFARFLNVL